MILLFIYLFLTHKLSDQPGNTYDAYHSCNIKATGQDRYLGFDTFQTPQ